MTPENKKTWIWTAAAFFGVVAVVAILFVAGVGQEKLIQ